MEPAVTAALSILLGLAAGVASGLFGVGGGVLIVPGLILLAAAPFKLAKAASLTAMAIGAIPGIVRHHRAGSVDWRTGLALGAGAVVASIASVVLVERVADAALQVAFGVFLVLVGARLWFPVAPRARTSDPRRARLSEVAAGAAAGLLGGAFGIGGGILMVPVLVFAGLSMHAAVATSLVAVVLVGAASTAAHLALGYGWPLLLLGLPVALGSLLGSRAGASLAHRLHADRLRRAFGAFAMLMGAYLAAAAAGWL